MEKNDKVIQHVEKRILCIWRMEKNKWVRTTVVT